MKISKTFAVVACITFLSFTAAAEDVYNNTFNDLTPPQRFETGSFEVGDQINLGGTARLLDTFSFEFYYTNTTGSAASPSISLTLYANDGPPVAPSGYATPGSELYSSGAIGGLITSLTDRATIQFDQSDFGNSVVLPDTLTWTVKFSGLTAEDVVGLDIYDPPTVGSSFDDYWINEGSGWELRQGGSPINFASLVAAVPEPSSIALLLVGGLGCAAWRRRS